VARNRHVWIVRRGNLDRFQTLTVAFADEAGVDVIWDRRVRERRQKTTAVRRNRRRDERRQPAPTSWVMLGMVLVVSRPAWDATDREVS